MLIWSCERGDLLEQVRKENEDGPTYKVVQRFCGIARFALGFSLKKHQKVTKSLELIPPVIGYKYYIVQYLCTILMNFCPEASHQSHQQGAPRSTGIGVGSWKSRVGETKEAGGQKDAHAQEDARILAEVGGSIPVVCFFFWGGKRGLLRGLKGIVLWKTSSFNMVDRVLYLPNECFTLFFVKFTF